MANSAYYVYAAEEDHRFLGRISANEKQSQSIDRLLKLARSKFKVTSIRIESRPRACKAPVGNVRVQPMVSRKGSW